ncbi:MAG: arsenite efflux transporter metallochaperone ArsD [Deltaproteobacteria bacterium]|jgi:hypothetical protein|nr:arsenite efflux transporter metallochaperone ArsD [Deltaproteobacteria bacterium]
MNRLSIINDEKPALATTFRVFDPAMCCSTGICGPSVDAQLVRFAADLDWLKSQGVLVQRFNLSQQPAAFVDDTSVRSALEDKGEASLPLIQVDGQVKSSGVYPSRAQLAAWAGLGSFEDAPKTASTGCCGPATAKDSSSDKSGCC